MNLVKSFAVIAGLMLATAGCGHHHGKYHHGEGDRAAAAERGKQAMAEAVQKAVPDPEKAKRVQEAIAEIMEEARQSYKANREQHQKLYELNANYSATPEEFTKILDDLNNGRMRTGATILAIRFKIKEMLTEAEWKALTDNLNAARGGHMHGHGSMEGKKDGY